MIIDLTALQHLEYLRIVIKKTLHILTSALIISCCLLACNTEQFRPKTKDKTPQNVIEEKKPLTAQEEQDQELIGAASIDYKDVDQSGNGIYGRKISDSFHEKLEQIKKDADPSLKGILKIVACIDQSGAILMARPEVRQTTMNNLDLQRKVGAMLIKERFEADSTAPDRQCGHVIVEF